MNEEYVAHFPTKLSDDIKQYAIEEAMKFSRYIFTHREGKNQFGYCTHCKTSFSTDRLKMNGQNAINWKGIIEKGTAECPKCKSQCTLKASGRGRKYMVDEAIFEYYEKSVIDPSILIAREIRVTMDYRFSYEDVKVGYSVLALYVFQMGNSMMLKRNYYDDGFFKTGSIYKNVEGYLNNLTYQFSCASLEAAAKGTPFQYSTWDSYSRNTSSMLKFFDLYSRYPCIEYLTKEGFGGLVDDKLWGRGCYRAVNWKADSIFKILKLNKNDLRELREYKDKGDALFLRLFQISKKDKSNLTLDEIKEVKEYGGSYFKELSLVHKYTTLRKINNYIKLQRKKEKPSSFKTTILRTWRDYIADCKTLDMNLKDEHVLFPKNLYSAHQNTIKQIKIVADTSLNIAISKRLKVLNKYRFESNELLIRPAQDSIELMEEGKALTHCVGGYADRYAKGETNIFFIRKVSESDKSYYTIEIQKDKIVQVRGKNNRSPSEDVKEFIKVFTEERLTKKKIKVQNRISITA